MDAGEGRGQQAVAAHGVEDAHLAEQRDKQHGDEAENRHDADAPAGPVQAGVTAKGFGNRIGDVQGAIIGDAGHDQGDGHIERHANGQRNEQCQWNSALRVFGFLAER